MPISKELKQAVLFAVAETAPNKAGGVQNAQLRAHKMLVGHGSDYIDRALQANATADLIQFYGKRDPKTGAIRKRWGWKLTVKGCKHMEALGL